jgi:hypothetical protein
MRADAAMNFGSLQARIDFVFEHHQMPGAAQVVDAWAKAAVQNVDREL